MGIFNFFKKKKEIESNNLTKHFDKNGNLISEGNYIEGKKNGLWKYYQEDWDGKLELEERYLNGNREGLSITYHQNGKISDEMFFKNDCGNGTCNRFNEKGILIESGNYLNGLYHGKWKYYDNSGNMKIIRVYEFGELISTKIK